MKRSLLVLAVMAMFTVRADYLYWMVTDDPTTATWQNYAGQTITFNDWDNAKLYYGGDSFTDGMLAGTIDRETADAFNAAGAYAYSDIGTPSASTTFFIELYNSDAYLGRAMGTYAEVSQFIFKSNSMAPLGSGWAPKSYAVPEPTSGLLFLVGGMLLGLKRRRQKV